EQIYFAHLFYKESLTYILKFYQIQYLGKPLILYEKGHCQTGIDILEWLVNQLRQHEHWRKSMPLGVETRTLLDCLYKLLNRLNNHVTSSHAYNNYIGCLDRLYQQIAYYSLSVQAEFSRLAVCTETKFTNAKFQHVRFYDLPKAVMCKIIVAGKGEFLTAIFWCVVDKLFTTETFAENDVLNWLPVLD
ncbi:MAG: hypothetical protein PUP92_36530, partial [Rhizonema sp. PD38]|nr:hypothetical protein [Rhizonema sp. PD38]